MLDWAKLWIRYNKVEEGRMVIFQTDFQWGKTQRSRPDLNCQNV